MSTGEVIVLSAIVGAFIVFAAALFCVERLENRKSRQSAPTLAGSAESPRRAA